MAQTRTDKFNDWVIPASGLDGDSARNICHCVILYFSDSFHKSIDLFIQQFQDRDWIEILHETFIIITADYANWGSIIW